MPKKGQIKATSPKLRYARTRHKALAVLQNLIVCLEFYYDHRIDYSADELNNIEREVQKRKIELAFLK